MCAVRWEDIGGLSEVKRRLMKAIEWPIQHRLAFERLGLEAPRGVLLHGPPGMCGGLHGKCPVTQHGMCLSDSVPCTSFSMFICLF